VHHKHQLNVKLAAVKEYVKKVAVQTRLRMRPEGLTTVIGEGARSDVKPTRQALKAAEQESERREPKSEFMSRLSQRASSGGVEMPRKRTVSLTTRKATPDQIREAIETGNANLEPEEGANYR
jgi:hypothetical protein